VGAEINSRTVAGLMAFCDWMKDKGYAGPAAADAWKSAAKVVFETVEGESYEAMSLDGIDLDDYVRRFQTLGGAKYRAETVGRYKNRIRTGMDAQAYYIEQGKPPSTKRGTPKPKAEADPVGGTADATGAKRSTTQSGTTPLSQIPPRPDFFEFIYPLSPGRMVRMELPMQMTQREIDRLCAVLQTLEEQPQSPERVAA
jgi:hypothetical protein